MPGAVLVAFLKDHSALAENCNPACPQVTEYHKYAIELLLPIVKSKTWKSSRCAWITGHVCAKEHQRRKLYKDTDQICVLS
ncbi:unnamed protein product [Cylicocyclus nassatus]|uniref:Uncharacterized protein n=1 Tax=Cylicocyclus nassatus TaxID=53992 RepID=A0AA36M137_CYLNA|nr:unnamed protein product [Cylicocyclus nassatus]